MKRRIIWALAATLCFGLLAIGPQGCTVPQQAVAYRTLFSVEKTTIAAYDAYLDLVIAGKVPTNDLPKVSAAFNQFQAGSRLAIAAAHFDTNAPVTPEVAEKSHAVLVTIAGAKVKR